MILSRYLIAILGMLAVGTGVVGWGDPDLVPPLAERPTPVWAFAGGRDPAVWPQFFYPGLNALE